MSSLVRRIEKAIMKKAGFTRERFKLGKNADGSPRLIDVRRGGVITDQNDDSIGYHWPVRIPVSAKPPTKPGQVRAYCGKWTARGDRRGKPNKAFIAARVALRQEGAR